MDFKKELHTALKEGKSLEDIMKEISAAASEIEKEEAAAAAKANKYLIYNEPLVNSYRGKTTGIEAITHSKSISVDDAATVLAHFVCQNTPGYAATLAKDDVNPIDMYRDLLKNQLEIAKTLVRHKDSPIDVKNHALWNYLFSEIF